MIDFRRVAQDLEREVRTPIIKDVHAHGRYAEIRSLVWESELTVQALKDGDGKWLRSRQVQVDRERAGGREALGLDTTAILPPLATTLPVKEQLSKLVNNVIQGRQWRELAVLFAQMEERFTTLHDPTPIRAPWEYREASMDIVEEIDLTDEPVVHTVDDDDEAVSFVKPDPDAPPLKRPRSDEEVDSEVSRTLREKPPEDDERRRGVLAQVMRRPRTLREFADLRADKEFVLTAVRMNGDALNYTSDDLRNDNDIVLAAVEQNGTSLLFASLQLQADKVIVLAAVKKNSYALKYASDDLKADKEIVLAAVKENGDFWKESALKADKEIALAAVQQDGLALKYGSAGLKNDKEVVLAAVEQEPWALEYATFDLRNDKEVVLTAVRKNGNVLRYASNELRNDPEVLASRAPS